MFALWPELPPHPSVRAQNMRNQADTTCEHSSLSLNEAPLNALLVAFHRAKKLGRGRSACDLRVQLLTHSAE